MGNKSAILFVDDEECIREIVKRFLPGDDFAVATFSNGLDALEAIKKQKPSMVFLDIRMPGRDGFEVLKDIKAMAPDVPVAMVTGNGNYNHAQLATQMGACDFILKPIDWNYLRSVAYLYTYMGDTSGETGGAFQ